MVSDRQATDHASLASQRVETLTSAAQNFVAVVRAVPDERYLTRLDEWTPRDVAAHLVWWNRHMISAIQELQAGKTPAYYADKPNNYRTVNAQAIAEFASENREELLAQLQSTLDEFIRFLLDLGLEDWDLPSGVTHYRGGAATINRVVESLISDYVAHARQIEAWQSAARG